MAPLSDSKSKSTSAGGARPLFALARLQGALGKHRLVGELLLRMHRGRAVRTPWGDCALHLHILACCVRVLQPSTTADSCVHTLAPLADWLPRVPSPCPPACRPAAAGATAAWAARRAAASRARPACARACRCRGPSCPAARQHASDTRLAVFRLRPRRALPSPEGVRKGKTARTAAHLSVHGRWRSVSRQECRAPGSPGQARMRPCLPAGEAHGQKPVDAWAGGRKWLAVRRSGPGCEIASLAGDAPCASTR